MNAKPYPALLTLLLLAGCSNSALTDANVKRGA